MMGMREKCVFCYLGVLSAALTLSTVWAGRRMTDDASDVTWAHAVNSKQDLNEAVLGNRFFLEADVSLGTMLGRPKTLMPIMAQPNGVSDVSLQSWMAEHQRRSYHKGIKLDFRHTEVLQPAFDVLKEFKVLRGPLWLHADILPGSGEDDFRVPVDPEKFLDLAIANYPEATISVGWTTEKNPEGMYEWSDIQQMLQIVRCKVEDRHNVTFAVRASHVSRSIYQLKFLADAFPRSSLTIWADAHDSFSVSDLLRLRSLVDKSKIYYDLPDKPATENFRNQKNNIVFMKKNETFTADNWKLTDPTGQTKSCSYRPFVSSDAALFLTSAATVIQLRQYYLLSSKFEVSARIRFFFPRYVEFPKNPQGNLSVFISSLKFDEHGKVIPGFTSLETIWDERVSKVGNMLALVYEEDTGMRKSTCVELKHVESPTEGLIPASDISDCKDEEDTKGFRIASRTQTYNELGSPVTVGIRFSGQQMLGVIYEMRINGELDPNSPYNNGPKTVPNFVCGMLMVVLWLVKL